MPAITFQATAVDFSSPDGDALVYEFGVVKADGTLQVE